MLWPSTVVSKNWSRKKKEDHRKPPHGCPSENDKRSRGEVIVDVREKDEWDEEHISDAIHLSRGTIELDIEEKIPDLNQMIITHCGGGGRSALAAENLQKMGYKNVRSMAGGFKAWKAAGLPMTK
ncbi:MAG: sulfurtransferase [Verrucomicrobia bacterium]|nr:MAG: sulfurtransferase [Verrucomicrobiota bacterium]